MLGRNRERLAAGGDHADSRRDSEDARDQLRSRIEHSRRRPTKLVRSAGRLPTRRACLAMRDNGTSYPYPGRKKLEKRTRITNSRDFANGVSPRTLTGMTESPAPQRVEVTFVGKPPPADRVIRAAGVSDVEIIGSVLRCQVHGSFQPFLEALRGYAVVSLTSIPDTSFQSTSGAAT